MNRPMSVFTGLVTLLALASLTLMSCRDIPNDNEKIPVTVNVQLSGLDKESFSNSGQKQVVMPAAERQSDKIIDPPAEEAIHLRITLTNPEEVFYVWNFNPAKGSVTITVSSGEDRVIEVEGYRVYGDEVQPAYNEFPAEHMITLNPVGERTLDLTGESKTVRIEMGYDPHTGVIAGGAVQGVRWGDTLLELPVDYECPPNMYAANLADKQWGLVFPSIPVDMSYTGVLSANQAKDFLKPQDVAGPSFYIDYTPRGKNIGVHLWHYTAKFYKDFELFTGDTVTSTGAFAFMGFDPTVEVEFSPESLQGVTVGSYPSVVVLASGGYGGFEYGETTAEDTCGGYLSGGMVGDKIDVSPLAEAMPGMFYVYVFEDPLIDDCTIGVEMWSCGEETSVLGSMQVDAATYCGDGYCNGSEDESSCAADCGEVTPPGMAHIPAGCFDMGDHFDEGNLDELPVHTVCLPSFYMDLTEVTNAEYMDCVTAGACTAPGSTASFTRADYYGNPTYDNFPVIYVSWNQATDYCTWAGKRLPTEAEWEYAARGGLSGKRYPWGDTATACVDANYDNCIGDTSEVESYPPNGYGLYDVGGNVFKWVNDWYQSDYYSSSPTNDPPGPPSGTYRVFRGGSWAGNTLHLRTSYRNGSYPTGQDDFIGFRCADDLRLQECNDLDDDGFYLESGCGTTVDCNDSNPNTWNTCETCKDNDSDTYFGTCNRYDGINGPDCDDADENNWNSCGTCTDDDSDSWYVDCDAYISINGPDCNDGNGAINPGALEITCDAIDNDCNAGTPDAPDSDSDGYDVCNPPEQGDSDGNTADCDDGNGSVNPGASEITCDAIDNDCDPGTEDAPDSDSDGYDICDPADPGDLDGNTADCNDADVNNWISCASCTDSDNDSWYDGCDAYITIDGPDCDDGDGSVNPGASEITCDAIDNDCDPGTEDAPDSDSDGYDICEPSDPGDLDGNTADCNDADENNWISCASCTDSDSDLWYDGCDAYITIDGPDCDDADENNWISCASCMDSDSDLWYDGCDAYITIDGPDCDDADENNWISCASCMDSDSDLWYDGCDAYITIDGPDCDDGNSTIYPGAIELCDGIDNQCPGDPLHGTVDMGCMAPVPSGCFDMGDAFSEGDANELPVHNVCITSDFYMDVHEVTNAEYELCVTAGACTVPGGTSSLTRTDYYGNPTYDNYPVIYVSWNQASAYCSWAGKRLPTEAEWEYAARGGLSGLRYPWGDTASACVDANYSSCIGDTSAAESYPANGYGLYDVGGNVYEWVNDWYQSDYYISSPTNDPPGPASGTYRVVRGGVFDAGAGILRVAERNDNASPVAQVYSLGIRCAGD